MKRIWAPVPHPLGSLFVATLIAFTLSACGGSKSPGAGGFTSPGPTFGTPATPAPTGGSGVSTPVVVSVAGGGSSSGVDIVVTGPASSPAPNAQDLGVAPLGPGGSAANTGATISRGASMKVLLFGAGLNGAMDVTIAGPNDIAVTNVRSATSTTGTPGIAFDVAVSGNAALGARTVLLKNQQNDITAFAGGLEVVP